MFAVKVEIGKERIRVRSYSNGFLPSYTSCAEGSMGRRMFVVPGYIFTMTRTSGAEKVPEAEWKVIEAISDSHSSTLDVKTQKIIDGPLKDLLILKINPVLKSVCIRAKLLGVTRDYWLAVKFVDATDDNSTINVVESKNSKAGEGRKMAKTTYTDEQIEQAIEKAKEVGIHAAGKELGIPWQAIQGFCKKAGVMEEASKQPAKKTKKTDETKQETKKAATKPATKKAAKKAKEPTSEPVAEAAPAAEDNVPTKRTRKATTKPAEEKAAKPAEEKKTTKPAEEKPASALEIENAVLKKENEQLKAKIEKLQKALAELI